MLTDAHLPFLSSKHFATVPFLKAVPLQMFLSTFLITLSTFLILLSRAGLVACLPSIESAVL